MRKSNKYMRKIVLSTVWANGESLLLNDIAPSIDGIEIGSLGDRNFFTTVAQVIHNHDLFISSIHASAGPHKLSLEPDYTPHIAHLDRRERERDTVQLIQTAEWAETLGVDRIVFHAGMIENEELQGLFRKYKQLFIYKKDLKNSLNDLKNRIIHLRSELVKPHLEVLMKEIHKVGSMFPQILFCIETRVNYYEIPLPEEANRIINELNLPNLKYWHDIGHTYINEKLGFTSISDWHRLLHDKCGGVHIHDIDSELTDHYPPGFGSANLPQLLHDFSRDIPWVLEINKRHNTGSVIEGIQYLKKSYHDK